MLVEYNHYPVQRTSKDECQPFSFFFSGSYVCIEARRNSNASTWPTRWKLEKTHVQEKEKETTNDLVDCSNKKKAFFFLKTI